MLDPFLETPFIDGSVQGRAIGFAPEGSIATPDLPAAVLGYAPMPTKAPVADHLERRWKAWGAAYGSYGSMRGDAATGSNDLTVRTGGFAAGLDYMLTIRPPGRSSRDSRRCPEPFSPSPVPCRRKTPRWSRPPRSTAGERDVVPGQVRWRVLGPYPELRQHRRPAHGVVSVVPLGITKGDAPERSVMACSCCNSLIQNVSKVENVVIASRLRAC